MYLKDKIGITKDTLECKAPDLFAFFGCEPGAPMAPGSELIINDQPAHIYTETKKLQPFIKELHRKPRWEKILMIERLFDEIRAGNSYSYHFSRTIAPFFFENQPLGEIWFVEVDEGFRSGFWEKERTLFEDSGIDSRIIQIGLTPQSMTGFDLPDVFPSIGLSLPFIIDFPFMYGINIPLWPGNFLFIADQPIHIAQEYQLNVTDALARILDRVHSDDRHPSYGPRLPTYFVSHDSFTQYLHWYTEHLASLSEYILHQSDIEMFFLQALTVTRILVETYYVQVSYSPFTRKVTLFNLLDKYANLITSGNRQLEPLIWKKLMEPSVYEAEIRPILENIDSAIESNFADTGSGIYKETEAKLTLSDDDYGLGDILRTYRNSHHGYQLKSADKELLLSHSGNIPNCFPDLSIVFWHALLENPSHFINSLASQVLE